MCNNDRLISDVSYEATEISDNFMVKALLSFTPGILEKARSSYLDEVNFRALDFSQADFDALNNMFNGVNWEEMRDSTTFEDFPAEFTRKVLDICLENVPRKRPPTGKPRVYNSLRRKKSKLNVRLLATKSANDFARAKELEDEIGLLSYKIKEAIVNHLDERERRAIGKIKDNPKCFYSYAKSFSKVKQSISSLFNVEKRLVTDTKDLADILQTQFCSVLATQAQLAPTNQCLNLLCHLSSQKIENLYFHLS